MPGIGDFLPQPPQSPPPVQTGIGSFLTPTPPMTAGQMYESGAGGGTLGQVASTIANAPIIKQVGDLYRSITGTPFQTGIVEQDPRKQALLRKYGFEVSPAGVVTHPAAQGDINFALNAGMITNAPAAIAGLVRGGAAVARGIGQFMRAAPEAAAEVAAPAARAAEAPAVAGTVARPAVQPNTLAAPATPRFVGEAAPPVPTTAPVVSTTTQGLTGFLPDAAAEASPPALTPVQTVIQALQQATPARAEQEALYSAERGRRIAAAASAGEATPGQAGYYAQLGALKGALPKAQFTPLQIDQSTADQLFDQVRASPLLSDFDKITAQTGLAKLFGAAGAGVPTTGELSMLGRVFGDEFVQTVQAKASPGILANLANLAGQAISVPKSIMASLSFVSPFRHGLFTAASYPRQFAAAFGQQFKYFASEDAYQAMAQSVVARPSYQAMEDHGLALTGLANAADPTAREEQFVGTLAYRIPGLGRAVMASNRAYTGFLTKLRADIWDELTQKAAAAGVDQSPQFLDGVANFINSATGRGNLGSLERYAGTFSTAMFSPRLLASRLNLLNPLYYASLPPLVRTDALRSLFLFAGSGVTALGLAKAGGAQVNADPTNSDFGKIRVGNTRIDLWGGFQQPIVLASRLITNQTTSSTTGKRVTLGSPGAPTRLDVVGNFIASKENPVFTFAQDLLKGKGFAGQPLNVPAEAVKMFVPMIMSSYYDLATQPDSAAWLGIPLVPFFGEQTYGPPPTSGIHP